MQKLYNYQSTSNYEKTLARLEKSIRSGQFAKFTQQKKQQIWNRLCRYARQLGIKIKASVAAACMAAGLGFAAPASAQTFVQETGVANPLNLVNVNGAIPTLVDIDGDGDMDAFVGASNGTVVYYKNTGTATAPTFVVQTGSSNPLDAVSVGYFSAPSFVDVDGDGDMDAFIGEAYGTILYYKNTGTNTAPVFIAQTGSANPFNGVDVGYYSIPTFADIDGDGDTDAFIGSAASIKYYKNTGTATAPVFVLQTGSADPFNGMSANLYSVPAFVDIDGDGDMDVFVGIYDGTINYYQNTGTNTSPMFVLQTGAANPLNGIDVGTYGAPAFVDIDSDGDMDVFIGEDYGTVSYYRNTSITLPLHLTSFSGNRQGGYNHLQWQTTNEVNSQFFEIERSIDGANFIKIATLKSPGNSNNNYSINDNVVYSGKVFYRLKMVDADGRFTYSQVIWINSARAVGISIYPNPVINFININIGGSGILKSFANIFDANGRLMQRILINTDQQQINVQSFAKGVYVIKFADGTVQSFMKK